MHTDFSLANSKYDEFLHEPIGEDARGITISMFSALARLKLDPFRESARLAALPLDAASRAIAERIGELNVSTWDAAETMRAAARLVKLLPKTGSAAGPPSAAKMAKTEAALRATTFPPMAASVEAFLQTLLRTVLPFAAGLIFLLTVGGMIADPPSAPGAASPFGNIPGLNSKQD